MKALIIIAACILLAVILSAIERVRCIIKETKTKRLPLDNPDELAKALQKYRDLEDWQININDGTQTT